MMIAIVGMACLFPGAQDIKRYWQNIINKVDAIVAPPEDWGGEFYFLILTQPIMTGYTASVVVTWEIFQGLILWIMG